MYFKRSETSSSDDFINADLILDSDPINKKGALFQGGIQPLSSQIFLKKNNITAVVSVLLEESINFPKDSHMLIPVMEEGGYDIYQYFNSACKFIEEKINAGENVYVHCYAGMTRSSTITTAFLMKSRGWRFEEAFRFLKSKRKIVKLNKQFQGDLIRFEKEVFEDK